MIFAVGIDWKIFKKILGDCCTPFVVCDDFYVVPHRIERVMTFVQAISQRDVSSQEYHISAGQNCDWLLAGRLELAKAFRRQDTPEIHFAVMGETFGFVGLMAILALFTALYYQFCIAARLPNATLC